MLVIIAAVGHVSPERVCRLILLIQNSFFSSHAGSPRLYLLSIILLLISLL